MIRIPGELVDAVDSGDDPLRRRWLAALPGRVEELNLAMRGPARRLAS